MNILLSSVGRRSYLVRYFQKALAGRGLVIATNSEANAAGMLAADRSIIVPQAGENGFIERLLDICQKFKVRILCSLHDWEAPFIARASDEFHRLGVIPVVSSLPILDTYLDKYSTFEFGAREGIRVPRTALGLAEALEQLEEARLSYPLIVKPRRGQGSICIETVYTEDELRAACLLIQRKISRMESNSILVKSGEENLIIQEYVTGIEYGLDVINNLNGCFAACFVKHKLAMRAGETDAAVTVDHPELESFGKMIGEKSGHIGLLDVDVMMDHQGPLLLEANPRFGGHYPFSHEAGANIPAALIAWAQGREPNPEWLRVSHCVLCIKDIAILRA
ncbi:MAG: ATP-grasp domain-containing protein [Desulfomonilia bacterium]